MAANMNLFQNANCGGSEFTIVAGDNYANFSNHSFNDITSSDKVSSTC
jgi:hypothetical protein